MNIVGPVLGLVACIALYVYRRRKRANTDAPLLPLTDDNRSHSLLNAESAQTADPALGSPVPNPTTLPADAQEPWMLRRQGNESELARNLRQEGGAHLNQARVRVFGIDADRRGRIGRVLSAVQGRGRATKHVVVWEDDGSKSTVLLQKVKGGKGKRFHLEPGNSGADAGRKNPMAPPTRPTKDVVTLKTRDASKYAVGQSVNRLGANRDLSGTVETIDPSAGSITVRLPRARA